MSTDQSIATHEPEPPADPDEELLVLPRWAVRQLVAGAAVTAALYRDLNETTDDGAAPAQDDASVAYKFGHNLAAAGLLVDVEADREPDPATGEVVTDIWAMLDSDLGVAIEIANAMLDVDSSDARSGASADAGGHAEAEAEAPAAAPS